jgi:hypothetical protein
LTFGLKAKSEMIKPKSRRLSCSVRRVRNPERKTRHAV